MPPSPALLALALAALAPAASGVRLYATLPSPRSHALFARHHTQPPELSLYSARAGTFVPGFGCCRAFNMIAPVTDWEATLALNTLPAPGHTMYARPCGPKPPAAELFVLRSSVVIQSETGAIMLNERQHPKPGTKTSGRAE